MTRFITFSLVLLFICSCNEKSPTTDSNEVVEIPESFVDFYERFHADSLFQMNHIVFPLAQKSDSTKWLEDNWSLHKAFNSQDGNYSRSFDNFNGIIIETIREKNNAFIITRRFAPSADSYNLIYYQIENKLEMWGEKVLRDSLNSPIDSLN